jgi:hypothetical protein
LISILSPSAKYSKSGEDVLNKQLDVLLLKIKEYSQLDIMVHPSDLLIATMEVVKYVVTVQLSTQSSLAANVFMLSTVVLSKLVSKLRMILPSIPPNCLAFGVPKSFVKLKLRKLFLEKLTIFISIKIHKKS